MISPGSITPSGKIFSFMVDKSPCLPPMIQLRLSEYVNKGSLYDILKDEITMPSISLQMKLCFIKGPGSSNKYTGNRPETYGHWEQSIDP